MGRFNRDILELDESRLLGDPDELGLSFMNVITLANLSKIFLVALIAVLVAGCEKAPAPAFRLNEVEILKQEKASLPMGEHFADTYDAEISNIVAAFFGTPDQPKLPSFIQPGQSEDDQAPIRLTDLQWAAGRVHSDQDGKPISGLYREHCSQCHGVSGDGAGPTAAFLNPYPRDFRLAKFKFKSTPLRRAPTDHDLEQILRRGIPGTAMPSFKTLPDEEIDALIGYVKYLSVRGQFERMLISELSSLEGESLLDLSHVVDGDLAAAYESLKQENNEAAEPPQNDQAKEAFEEQLEYIVDELYLQRSLSRWINPEDSATKVPTAPDSIATNHPQHAELVDKGRKLFFTKGNCAQCHGDTAMGDGETDSYDDWTNDWIKSAGVNPKDKSTYKDFSDAGALKPRPIRPRNLRLPFYRGGGSPEEIYLRIRNGIEGTPMPAAATLKEEEIWALVAYTKWLPFENVAGQQAKLAIEKSIDQ